MEKKVAVGNIKGREEMTERYDYFIYEMMSIHGFDAPILMSTLTKKAVFNDVPPEQFDTELFMNRRIETLKDQKKLDFLWLGKNLAYSIWYTRDLPQRHYIIKDKLFVLSEETKLGDGMGAKRLSL